MEPTEAQLARQVSDARRSARYDEALEFVDQLIALAPRDVKRLIDKSEIQRLAGRTEEAQRTAHKATVLAPVSADARAALGQAFLEQRKLNEAERHLLRALEIDRRCVRALEGMGTLRLRQKRYAEAEATLADAIRQEPQKSRLFVLLGDVFAARSNQAGMVEAYRRGRDLDPLSPAALQKYVAAKEAVGGVDAARQAFEEAVARMPQSSMAHQMLGEFLAENGLLDDAVLSLRHAVELEPTRAHAAVVSLARAKSFRDKSDHDFSLVSSAYAATEPGSMVRADLAFAFAKVLDDLKDYDAAFDLYEEANRIRRPDISMERERRLFHGIASSFSAEFLARLKGQGHPSQNPIFVVGMPRSGTTLTETVLARNPIVYPAGELDFLREAGKTVVGADATTEPREFAKRLVGRDLVKIAEGYLASLDPRAQTAVRFTDKMPHNFLLLGLIRLALPNARIVHVRRDPVDTCLSMFKANLAASGLAFTYDLTSLGQYYNLYRSLMRHWRRVMPGEFFEIDYEQLVSEPEATSKALYDYCELDWSPQVVRVEGSRHEVKTASMAQVRRAINTGSVRSGDRYGSRLDPLRAALAEWTED